jgi:hypothetical protein
MHVSAMKIRMIVIVCGTALLIAAAVAVVVALRNRQQPAPPPDAPVAASPAEVRVKAVERKPEMVARENVTASGAVAVVCGADKATANRYEARNDALRSITHRRDLPKEDVAALMAYLRSKDSAMRPERVAALKNDVNVLSGCLVGQSAMSSLQKLQWGLSLQFLVCSFCLNLVAFL